MSVNEGTGLTHWVEMRQAGRLGDGFLMTRRHVMTAAHCVRDLPMEADLTVMHGCGIPRWPERTIRDSSQVGIDGWRAAFINAYEFRAWCVNGLLTGTAG